jgi:hypothetical protein
MIDKLVETQVLLMAMRALLPLSASFTKEAAAALAKGDANAAPRGPWRMTEVHYVGDEGGIMCRMVPGEDDTAPATFISLTHLHFMANAPLAREIAAYQKHRIKKLKKLGAISMPLRDA